MLAHFITPLISIGAKSPCDLLNRRDQSTQETFSFVDSTGVGRAVVVTRRAEIVAFATDQSDDVNAGAAEGFVAVLTLHRGGSFGVVEAAGETVRQSDRAWGCVIFELRHHDAVGLHLHK